MVPASHHGLRPMRIARCAALFALLAAVLMSVGACSTPHHQTLVGEPPPDDPGPAQARAGGERRILLPDHHKRRLPDKRYPKAIFGAPVWPFIEDGTTFELTWGAAAASIAVHEQPDLNSAISGEYHLARGDKIPWRSSWVGVYRPSIFRAKTEVHLDGTRYVPGNPDLNDSPISATVHPGQPVAVYQYAGGATCYVGVGQTVMLTSCPAPHQFNGDFSGKSRAEQMQPEKRVWWVRVETASVTGWIALDDRVQVDLIND